MASISNSTPLIPSTGTYEFPLSTANNYQFSNDQWDDVKSYNSTVLTVKSGTPGYVKLRWAQGHETEDGDDVFPDQGDLESPLAEDYFYHDGQGVITKQFDVRSRWLNVWFDGSLTGAIDTDLVMSTVYKKAATEIKITDDDVDIVPLNIGNDVSNSLLVGITDSQGQLLNTTMETQNGESLFTHLADSSGASLTTTDHYRDIIRTDQTDFSFNFTNDINSDDLTTVIVDSNEFMLNNDKMSFKHGDIIKFIVLRDGESDASVNDIMENGGNGHLIVRAKVNITQRNDKYTRFQLLVNNDLSKWFDNDIKEQGFDTIANFQEMNSGNPDFVTLEDGHYKLTTYFDSSFVLVDDYYNIFADPSGFNQPGGIVVGPGRTPLDLRIFQGSFHNTNREVYMILEQAYNPKESLVVTTNDSSGLPLASTKGEDSFHYQNHECNEYFPRVLVVIDDTSEYYSPDTDTADFLKNVALSFGISGAINDVPNYYNMVYQQTSYSKEFNLDSNDGPCYAIIQSSSLNNFTDVNDFMLAPNTDISDSNTYFDNVVFQNDSSQNFNLWKSAVDTVSLIDEYKFTDVVFITSSAGDFEETTLKDELDKYPSWKSVNRYITVPESVDSEDVLHFVSGIDDHILSYPNDLTSTDDVNNSTDFGIVYQPLLNQIHKIKHKSHNSLYVNPTNVLGTSQAATQSITGSKFGDTALYYSLTDSSGLVIDSTKSSVNDSSNNSLFVHLNIKEQLRACSESIGPNTPLPVSFQGAKSDGQSYDLTVSGPLTTALDIANGPLNLHSVNIVNETPNPVWVRLYDVSQGKVDELGEDFSEDLSGNIVFNLPVPGMYTRDIPLARPVTLVEGLHFAASTNYKRDSLYYPPGKKHIYVTGNYKSVTVSDEVLQEFLNNNDP
jgi:hypothetical protein